MTNSVDPDEPSGFTLFAKPIFRSVELKGLTHM